MSSLDDIVTIVEFHRRRWKPPASLTISLTKSLRVAGSLVVRYVIINDFVKTTVTNASRYDPQLNAKRRAP